MDEESHVALNVTRFIVIAILATLFVLNIIEIVKLRKDWKNRNTYDTKVFDECIKPNLLIRTGEVFFTTFFMVSIVFLILFLSISSSYFERRVEGAYLTINYLIFGIYLTGYLILIFINWNLTMYDCKNNDPNDKHFSFMKFLIFLICLIISLGIFVLTNYSDVSDIYYYSLLRKEGGYKFIREMFWKRAFKNRNDLLNQESGGYFDEKKNSENKENNISNINSNINNRERDDDDERKSLKD